MKGYSFWEPFLTIEKVVGTRRSQERKKRFNALGDGNGGKHRREIEQFVRYHTKWVELEIEIGVPCTIPTFGI